MSRKHMPVHLRKGNKTSLTQEEKQKAKDQEIVMAKCKDALDNPSVLYKMDAKTKQYYYFILQWLKDAGLYSILSSIDTISLYQMAKALYMTDECDKEIKKYGMFIDTAVGSAKKPNPALNERRQSLKTFYSIATEFGLTPSSRAALAQNASESVFIEGINLNGLTDGLDKLFESANEEGLN
ncbi:P27 family phage terminase small subunit [Peribacillus sp. ACCC06369]|uniref:P27 family phage terminase small subunit n=1 Tax=Peribacillus sp. ACCC06369 TaxID=3055860 RepID=UPI0025A042B9|nr:P27 family phage terminase small subunit [Peribacillus sp. ACCC06369]MDM5361171.1 P27 family phage terminase small subunit [Peribacillus sp. ACCC06369]